MTNKFENGLFIFRRDLRIIDNNGLNLLNEKCKNIFTIFIFTPEQVGNANKYKSMRIFQGTDSGSITNMRGTILADTTWSNTSAITNIKFIFDSTYGGNVLTPSKVALYGIKAAV